MNKTLDPGAARVVDMARKSNANPPEEGTPAMAREGFRTSRAALAPPTPPVASLEDIQIEVDSGTFSVRVYRGIGTNAEDALPSLLFFHSGGWVSGDLETHDTPCRAIANLAHCAVIAVDYRLAPENPFPAAIEDAQAAYDFLTHNAERLAIDPNRIAVGGDSAGANIATVLALHLRNAKASTQPVMQVLLYPATDFEANTASLHENKNGPGLTASSLNWFANHYLPNDADRLDWRASPLRTPDLSGLPPTYLATCGFDPLRDEGEDYGKRLNESGVKVQHHRFEGQIHGFLTMGGVVPETTILIGEVAAALDRAFSGPLNG